MEEDPQDHPGPADLRASLERSDADIAAGRVRPFADAIQMLRPTAERMQARRGRTDNARGDPPLAVSEPRARSPS